MGTKTATNSGMVKFFNHSKGYGFIFDENGNEYFFHITGIIGSNISLRQNDKVTFELQKDEIKQKIKAINIQLIKK